MDLQFSECNKEARIIDLKLSNLTKFHHARYVRFRIKFKYSTRRYNILIIDFELHHILNSTGQKFKLWKYAHAYYNISWEIYRGTLRDNTITNTIIPSPILRKSEMQFLNAFLDPLYKATFIRKIEYIHRIFCIYCLLIVCSATFIFVASI